MHSFSQTTYPKIVSDSLIVITPHQLKQTNLIFLDRTKLQLENKELNTEITNYKQLYFNCTQIDSLQRSALDNLRTEVIKQDVQIAKQATSIKKQKNTIKYLTIGGISVSLALLVCIIK